MLSTIKISGFKSFADPVSIPFRDRLVGIVGPNGCGKSNIADALRWVLGEGSAKSLRADFMGDVIFSGTRERKAMSRADVEVVFDNSQRLFGGEYASYAEISIRREVASDGQSKYYLNGTTCRRRDIVGLFLGTGLGTPNYAIVQQGMINRFIEANPQEMRMYLEEASGISYFRKQRSEAVNNLNRTAENLTHVRERLDEINRHIAHLEKQSRSAVRYRNIIEEQASLRACRIGREIEETQNKIEVLNSHIDSQDKQNQTDRLQRDQLSLAIDQGRAEQNQLRTELDQITEKFYAQKKPDR